MRDCHKCISDNMRLCHLDNDDDCIPIDDLVCPNCGSASTGEQDEVGCIHHRMWTEFECGSKYVVFYYCGVNGSQSRIVSMVARTSLCAEHGQEDII